MSEQFKRLDITALLNGSILAAVVWFGSNVADANVKIARIEADIAYLKREVPRSTTNRDEIAALKERVSLLEARNGKSP